MTSKKPEPVSIHLEKGAVFEGMGWGDFSQPRGSEFVFCTAMGGLEESLTDPSFARQTVVSTVSHAGNTGYTGEDLESGQIWAEGLVCRHLETQPSNWRAKQSVPDWILGQNRYIVSNVDTRSFTTLLREEGSQRGIVARRGSLTDEAARLYIQKNVPEMGGLDLTTEVSCKSAHDFVLPKEKGYWPLDLELISRSRGVTPGSYQPEIIVWDFGVKQNTLRSLATLGARVRVVPASTKAEDILAASPDGILLSNGPGDPAAATHIIAELKKLLGRVPIFAICLGHQFVAHAAGLKTYKMKFGHRGVHHPVTELDRSGHPVRTWITSQNHGFAVDAERLPEGIRVSFLHADDSTVEGLSLPELQCETVQFHPEAGPGPFEASRLLKNFVMEVATRGRA